eukprot:2776589-Alexandrium_andersonii.AAC.1
MEELHEILNRDNYKVGFSCRLFGIGCWTLWRMGRDNTWLVLWCGLDRSCACMGRCASNECTVVLNGAWAASQHTSVCPYPST